MNPTSGFDDPTALSERRAGFLDVVLVNGNILFDQVWDVGVINESAVSPGTSDYQATFATGSALAMNTPEVLSFEEHEMLMLRELKKAVF